MRKSARERKNYVATDEVSVSGFLKIIIGILIVLVVFTAITYFVTRDKSESETPKQEPTIQYSKIIVGSILNRDEKDYYVLVEAKDDSNISDYESSINIYNNKEKHLRFYTVDLSDPFNESYVSDEAKLDVKKISDIKFSETTLLHIQDGKIASYRVGEDISTYLTKLSA